ncbi:MAG TPA: hypothetical protein VIW93_04775 [Candidatus Acidoferrum sp.]|jgi:hypothetical protein
MTAKTPEQKKAAVGARGLTPEELQTVGRELCTCGHRAINHAALKYACQSPGNRKGYCPCMRFLPKSAS